MNIGIANAIGFQSYAEEKGIVQNGLVLHYDFSKENNSSPTRGVARDLSGNGNDGVLQNFSYRIGSGYQSEREVAEQNHLSGDAINWENGTMAGTGVKSASTTRIRVKEFVKVDPSTRYVVTVGSGYEVAFHQFDANGTFIIYHDWTTLNTVLTSSNTANLFFVVRKVGSTAISPSDVRASKVQVNQGSTPVPWAPAPGDVDYEGYVQYDDRGLKFDGVDDYVDTNLIPRTVFGSGDFTVSFTVTLHHLDVSKMILSANQGGDRFYFVTRVDNGIGIGIGTVQKNYFGSFALNEMFNIQFIKKSGLGYFYVDGVLVDGAFPITGSLESLSTIKIGTSIPGGSYQNNMSAFSLYMYDRALTGGEITRNYELEKAKWNL